MNLRIILNDIRRSKLITLGTTMFVATASLLVVLAAVLVVNLSGSIDHLMTQAKTPHFMQMHTGDYDKTALEAFVQGNDNVEEYQILEFLNVEGREIVIGEDTLANSVLDNGFSSQSKQFDYLLDMSNELIYPMDGEVYLPLSLMKNGTAQVGDRVTVGENHFVVAGFLRDSQMNSTLASSQRFLVSQRDYDKLRSRGVVEYLIEFRLKDVAKLGVFETAYANAEIASNGPAITYPQFRIINALSDGLMIAVILLISGLVVAIAFLCIRFTLLAKIQEDYREIGVMKAIGMTSSAIKKIYLAKYIVIAGAGSLLGFCFSYVFRGPLLENIRLYMGDSGKEAWSFVFGMAGVLLVFFITILYVNRVLGQMRRISPGEALRFGTDMENNSKRKSGAPSKRLPSLQIKPWHSVNTSLGIRAVWQEKRLYMTLAFVLILSVFIFLLPLNLHHTLSSAEFVRYMGIGKGDILISIGQTQEQSRIDEIIQTLQSDREIQAYTLLTTKSFPVERKGIVEGKDSIEGKSIIDDKNNIEKKDNILENIKVELGDHRTFPVEYSMGNAPTLENEIALSSLNAEELALGVGDNMTLHTSQGVKKMVVCGIYSDITNGGKTAKANFQDEGTDTMWSSVYLLLTEKSQIKNKVAEYTQLFPFAKVVDIPMYMVQTFGNTIHSVGLAAALSSVLGPGIAFLITLLFMKMMVSKEKYPIAVMKAIGFTTRDIGKQFMTRGVLVLSLSLVAGTLLAATLGQGMAGLLISSFGVTSFHINQNPWATLVLSPLMIGGATVIAVILATSAVKPIKISENIKE